MWKNDERSVLIFDLMCEVEPDLKRLVSLAESHRHLDEIEREHYWYRDLKKQMFKLVGIGAKKEILGSSLCYDIAYHKLIDVLGV